MSETTGLKKLLYKTLKNERVYAGTDEDPYPSSACLFSYYTTEEIRMNVYLKITYYDDDFKKDVTRTISFYFNDFLENDRRSISNVIPKVFRSDIVTSTYNLYGDKNKESNIRYLFIEYYDVIDSVIKGKIKKISLYLEILSGQIYSLNFDESTDNLSNIYTYIENGITKNITIGFKGQGLFNTKAVSSTMLNSETEVNMDEWWSNDTLYNSNILFTHSPFQIHNAYVSDYSGIRFGSGSKKIDIKDSSNNIVKTESGNAYINIYTGDDKDPI